VSRFLVLSLFSSAALLTAAPSTQGIPRSLVFEPNRGQAVGEVKWIARGPGYQLFLAQDGITMRVEEKSGETGPQSAAPKYTTVKMKLANGHPWSQVTGSEPTGGVSNYLRGQDSENWLTQIPHYSRVSVVGVYDGIDLVLRAHGRDLEYDFMVAPGANPKAIRLEFEGMDRMQIEDKSGDLLLTTVAGTVVRQARPRVYQLVVGRQQEVAGAYELAGGKTVIFSLAAYDHRTPLVIDPTVSLEQLFIANGDDIAFAAAVDSTGAAYLVGSTSSTDFPTKLPIDPTHHCDPTFGCIEVPDAFVMKISPLGEIAFSTFLGGQLLDAATGVAVDSTGVVVVGLTGSVDFPSNDVRHGADAFVVKLSLAGDRILYSRTFGGSGFDVAKGVAMDSQHNAWVVGTTISPDFPTTTAPSGIVGNGDAFYLKVTSTGTLAFSQLIGGSGADQGLAIAVDRLDEPWITGGTCSSDFPVSPGLGQATGTCGPFVALRAKNGAPRFATRFGGSDNPLEYGTGIAVVSNRFAYVTGTTFAPNFPITPNAYQQAKFSQGPQGFVTEVDATGHIVHSTFVGGPLDTSLSAIAVDNQGDVFVVGSETQDGLIVTDGFGTRLSPDLAWAPYILDEMGTSVNGLALYPTSLGQAPAFFVVGNIKESNHRQDAFYVKWTDDNLPTYSAVWHNPTTGDLQVWDLSRSHLVTAVSSILGKTCGASDGCSKAWRAVAIGDFDRNGEPDILWHNATTGEVQEWLLNSARFVTGVQSLSRKCGASNGCSKNMRIIGTFDVNRDGIPDVFWHNATTGAVQIWVLNQAGTVTAVDTVSSSCGSSDGCSTIWKAIGIGDVDQDGFGDLVWQNMVTGELSAWLLNDYGHFLGTLPLSAHCGNTSDCPVTSEFFGFGEFNADRISDLLWHDTNAGELFSWDMDNRGVRGQSVVIPSFCGSANGCSQMWKPVGVMMHDGPRFTWHFF
jgi:hypothetical protein